MRRVLVIGSPGAGKTTVSTRLAAQLAVPVHYREAAEARDRVRLLTETPQWVMDGNFAETFDLRMPRADTLIWLDYPRITCIRRILARTIKDYGRQKPDLPEGCPEKFDAGVLRFAWRFPRESRPQIMADLERFGGHLHVFHLCNDHDVAEFARTQGLA